MLDGILRRFGFTLPAFRSRELGCIYSIGISPLKINQDKGFILRSFKKNLSVNESLNPASLNQILKSLQKKACLNNIGELSGHSFRVGAALDLLERGISLERIMLRGGWKSDSSAMRYLRSWQESSYIDINQGPF